MLYVNDINLKGKKVLIRQDLNVPIKNGIVSSDKRIKASIPTIKLVLEKAAKVILMSHLGRPKEGEFDEKFSLKPVAEHLSKLLDQKVRLVEDWLDGVDLKDGEVVLCENVRFNKGEKSNDETLAKKMAGICDVFVMDAFGTSHRAQASTYGVTEFANVACAGPLLSGELKALAKALENPKRPMVAIVGGSKVSTKLTVLGSLSKIVDQLIVGGGIANTFILASDYTVGKSLCEEDLVKTSQDLIKNAKQKGSNIPIPKDVVCGKEFSENAQAQTKSVNEIENDDMIFDIGPKTSDEFCKMLKSAGTIIWNGPVGVFEFDQFGAGTKAIANAIAESAAFSVAGGGDTLAAVDKYGIEDKISYISTGGGAFLEFLEGKKLPAVDILEKRSQEWVNSKSKI